MNSLKLSIIIGIGGSQCLSVVFIFTENQWTLQVLQVFIFSIFDKTFQYILINS